jgi:hypothetical protein
MWCTTTRWRRTTESTSSRASATQTRMRPTLSRDKEVGGTFWDIYGIFWGLLMAKEVGHFRTFTSSLFRAKGWDILGLLWDILGLLHPTFFRAKEVGHFRTFTSSPFQGQGGWAFLNFYVQPFLEPRGWGILDIRNSLMQTVFTAEKEGHQFFCIQQI